MIWTPKQQRIVEPSVAECRAMGLGLGLGISFTNGPSAPADPLAPIAALAHTLLLYSPDYAGGTWTGSASVGTSGGRNATSIGADPTVGAALNGHPTVSFDGTDYLSFAYALSTVLSSSAWSFWCLCKLNSAAQILFCDQVDGYVLLGVDAGGVWSPVQFSGGYSGATAAGSFGSWQLVQARYGAGAMTARVNSGAWSAPVTVGAPGSLAQLGRLGASYNAASKVDGLVAGMGAAAVKFSDANFDSIVGGLNTWGGLAL